VVATYRASARPARSITRLSIVAALSGRPAPPKQVHRSTGASLQHAAPGRQWSGPVYVATPATIARQPLE
jgi:hypothetical protein